MGDAVHHYVQLRSLVFDRDLHLRNEYLRIYKFRGDEPEATWLSETTPTGHVRSYMPVGPGLVWAPALLSCRARFGLPTASARTTRSTATGVRFRRPPPSASHRRRARKLARLSLRVGAVRSSTCHLGNAGRVAIIKAPMYYSLISPTYSHAASMLAVGAFWLAWMRTMERQTIARYGMMGVLVGVAALMRWQDGVLLLLPLSTRSTLGRRTTGRWRRGWQHWQAVCSWGSHRKCAGPSSYGQPFALPQGPALCNGLNRRCGR